MSRITRLATAARVYMKNGPTIYLAARTIEQRLMPSPGVLEKVRHISQTQREVGNEIKIALDEGTTIDGVTTEGERIHIPASEVLDVVYPSQSDVAIPAGVFFGKRLQVRNLRDYTKAERPDGITLEGFDLQGDPDDYTVLTGEDLGEAEICVVNVATGHVAWLNPAVPTEANDLAVQATIMLARMEELTNLAYYDNATALEDPDLGVQDIENGRHHYQAGNVAAAVDLAGADLVTEWIAQDASGPDVCVRVEMEHHDKEHHYGVITAFRPEDRTFEVQSFDGEIVYAVISEVDEIMSFSWEDFQRTGDHEQFLTDAGRTRVIELPVPAN